jgi:hypothetical protein
MTACIIAYNTGGGLYSRFTPYEEDSISNCDLFGNSCLLDDWESYQDYSSRCGNKCRNPLFCKPDSGDYHLYSQSPCAPAKNGGLRIGALDVGCSSTDVADDNNSLPAAFALSQNYPNPFNPSTKIGFRVSGLGSSWVKLSIYDMLGREVAILVNEEKMPGRYEVRFDASALPSGVYFYRIQVRSLDSVIERNFGSGIDAFVETRKLLLMP